MSSQFHGALSGPPDSCCQNLAKVVAVNKALRSLNLSGNLFDEAAAAAWAIVLRGNRELKQLHLNGCHLNDAAGIHLANSLIENEGLEVLSMRDNSIRDAGASAFAEALHHNGTVTQLNLELNSTLLTYCSETEGVMGFIRYTEPPAMIALSTGGNGPCSDTKVTPAS
eukprot:s1028_g7.t1